MGRQISVTQLYGYGASPSRQENSPRLLHWLFGHSFVWTVSHLPKWSLPVVRWWTDDIESPEYHPMRAEAQLALLLYENWRLRRRIETLKRYPLPILSEAQWLKCEKRVPLA